MANLCQIFMLLLLATAHASKDQINSTQNETVESDQVDTVPSRNASTETYTEKSEASVSPEESLAESVTTEDCLLNDTMSTETTDSYLDDENSTLSEEMSSFAENTTTAELTTTTPTTTTPTTTTPVPRKIVTCPTGYTLCLYKEICLKMSSNHKTWYMAKEACEKNQSSLLVLEEPQFINWFRTLKSQSRDWETHDSTWIAGKRDAGHLLWEWHGRKTGQMYHSDFEQGEPNINQGNSACLITYGLYKLTWEDEKCDKSFRYVCEKPATVNWV